MPAGSGAGHLCPEHRRLDNLVKLADVTEGDERRSVPLVDRAWKAEAGIGGGVDRRRGRQRFPASSGARCGSRRLMEPVAKECYTYTRSWAGGQPTTTGHET